MPLKTVAKRFLKFPLVWVMLLWAITSPGQEEAIYSYLVKGAVHDTCENCQSGGQERHHALSQTHAAVSWDAHVTGNKVLHTAPAVFALPRLSIAALSVNAEPLPRAPAFVAALCQAMRIAASVLPNAP
ncbi:hypothetical protein [uncultured Pontibacter sp.]|uniref:hypothetical protein n=1 Tax=uncultured Pontibacter sp. TaxID=453356 RepID=UPI002616A873|nr:hypothetical protein [uncultured Pontibacter sp.]